MDKTQGDLNFAAELRDFARTRNWRVVVYGGYGLDLYLGRITRHHRDLDLVIYGQGDRATARKVLSTYIYRYAKSAIITIKQAEYQLEIDVKFPRFAGTFYYVQTKLDPFSDLRGVVKANGELVINSENRFPPPVIGKIGELEIEVQDQHAHLTDMLYKKGTNMAPTKYDQDIENLKKIV